MLTGLILIYTWIPFLLHLQCKDDQTLRVRTDKFVIRTSTEGRKRPNERLRTSLTSDRSNQALVL